MRPELKATVMRVDVVSRWWRERPGQLVRGRDGALLRFGVPGQPDHGHPFPQHGRDRTMVGRSYDEERLGRVERQVEMVVAERRAPAQRVPAVSALPGRSGRRSR